MMDKISSLGTVSKHIIFAYVNYCQAKTKTAKMTWKALTACSWAWRKVRPGLHRRQQTHPPIPWRRVAAPAKE